jgi:hypothetical protein
MRIAVFAGVGLWIATLGCEPPPSGQSDRDLPGPSAEKLAVNREFTASAHREAHARLVEDAIEPLRLADPIAAAQLGCGALAGAPISVVDRRALALALEPVWSSAGEIDESALEPDQVVVMRTLRFGFERIHEEIERRPQVRTEPLAAVRAIEQLTDEIEYRLIQGQCDEACGAAMKGLSDTLTSANQQLAASSIASVGEAARRARALAERLRGLSSRSSIESLSEAAAALEAHALVLEPMGEVLRDAEALEWSMAAPAVLGGEIDSIRRLPGSLGERALSRMLSVEERIDVPPAELWAQTQQHVARWQRLRAELVGGELGEDPAGVVDVDRCNAARERIAAGLAGIPKVDAPTLDCARWVAIRGAGSMREGELVLALIDVGWIEPQRRRVRAEALVGVGLIGGQWSGAVHRHLRRVMLLAKLNEPHALALALEEGRAALCLAGAALWIHGELGPADELRLASSGECAGIGDPEEVRARVMADPRGALAGLGLGMIGDEPAAMAGFDRFWWAPLGGIGLLATPAGVHPDGGGGAREGGFNLTFEELSQLSPSEGR